MSSIDSTIVLISMPAIFRGINLDPTTSFQYLLWIMFGYMIVTATLLVTFGRISDIHGRVRLYNIGFAIFAIGSTLIYFTPNTGDLGALEIRTMVLSIEDIKTPSVVLERTTHLYSTI